ncbi:translocation/assembly module TamB domain-containing protein [Nevskia soli]|uniref:translocation/assembly module TamB domain-containing protein n=1 Tax=Nevskia soli TaxID=418856 RepID=UPI0004A7351F|nr:translocation/assembly module TamB domain-containing protein [Nevskia soli]
MRRILLWTLAALLVLLLLLGGGAWWLLDSDGGLRGLAALTNRYSGGMVRLGTTQGRLLGEFIIEDLHYQGGDGTRVDVERVHLRLVPRELLSYRLHLEVAEVQALQVSLPPPRETAPTGETQLPSRLPFDTVIDALSLKDFQLHQPGETGPFRIASAALKGSWIGEDIVVERLSAELTETGPLLLSAKARMADDRIVFSALNLKGPGEIEGSGTFAFGKSANDLRLSWKDLRWPLTGDAAERRARGVDGEVKFSGPLHRYHVELSSAAVLHELPIRLAATGDGDLQQIQIADLGLTAGKGSAHVQGKLAWAPLLRADLKGTISQIDPALFVADWAASCVQPPAAPALQTAAAAPTTQQPTMQQPTGERPAPPPRGKGKAVAGCAAGSGPSSINGSFNTQTTVQNGQTDIAFTANIDKSQLRGYPLSLSAQGDTDTRSVRLKQFLLQSGKGSLSATGVVGWAPALRADLQAQLSNFDPTQFVAAFPGSINGSIVTRTTGTKAKPDIALAVKVDRSQLRGHPLNLDADASLSGETVMVQKLLLVSGSTRVEASGQATPPFDLKGKVASPNLSELAPELGGRADFDFTLQGPLDSPHLVSKGHADSLRYLAYRVNKLDWDADIDPSKPSHLSVNASEAQAGILIHTAKLSLTGQETYHHAQVDVVSERGDVSLAVDGGFDRRKLEWGGQVSSGRLAPTDLPPWTLEKAAGLLLGSKRQSLEPTCFSGGAGRACVRLEQNVTATGLRLSLDIDKLLLAAFKPLLPPKYDLSGEISGNANIEIAHGDVAAMNADLHTDGIHIQAPKAPAVEIQASTLKADDKGGTLHALLDLRLLQGSIGADVTAAPGADFQARPLSGHVQTTIPDLGFVQSFVPDLQAVGGSISGTLDLGGTIGLPRLQGQIALVDGRAKVPRAGIELQQVQLRLTGKGEGPLAIDGSLQSGGGNVAINGTLDPSVAPPRADLKLQGENFQALATTDARIWVSPDLHLLSDADGMHLEGTLTVPKAEITPQGLGNNGVAISEDQVIVGAEPTAEEQPLKLYSRVTVTLGDAVSFKGFGLTTRLEGGVTVAEEPQRVATGNGELRLVEGRYQAYGQDLTIETGRLIFDGGAITEPAVDLYATRHPQADVTVGVRVRGTLDKPLLTLQSEPSMPREQQLSWLVLGRSLDQSSSSDRSAVSQAALSLGLSGGDYFAQKFGKSIGLDQISIGQGPISDSSVAANATTIQGSQAAQNAGTSTAYSSQAAQLTLGKYLTPKLFISYGVSLFQPGQTFRLLYDLGHGFKLQTESGVASGGDLIYTFERGK